MRLVTCQAMRDLESEAMKSFGLDGETLMLNAARAIVRTLKASCGPGPVRTAVFCGKGNNAGDGWAAAMLLAAEGWPVKVYHPGLDAALPAAAAHYRAEALKHPVPEGSWREGIAALDSFDLLVDALLGTGIRDRITGEMLELIEAVNRSGLPVLAVDIPSGIMGDTGQVAGAAVRATRTVTFGCAKLGLAIFPGREYAGDVTVDPIGMPEILLEKGDSYWVDKQAVAGMLPIRSRDSHKGSNGRLLIVGGAEGMTGAPVLSGMGGLRAGAGLVTLGRRPGLNLPEKPAELMTVSWPEIRWDRYDAMVVGPGLSVQPDGKAMLEKVLGRKDVPRVVDADGLNLLAEMGFSGLEESDGRAGVILTPHPGEMARLCGISTAQVQADRIGLARSKARDWGATLVLKGAATLVTTPTGRLWVNPTGNPGMATAGTGDVLAGVIGGLLAQGLKAEDAAVAGVYLHGLAGDLAAEEMGEIGLVAGDLLPRLPKAIRSVMKSGTVRRTDPPGLG